MPSPAIQIVPVKPQGYTHSETFAELAETLRDAFLELGSPTGLAETRFDPTAVNLVLGWHLLTETQEAELPAQCILYNLEQMDEGNRPFVDRLVRLSERCEIWDYSRRNIGILHRSGFPGAIQHVPIGTMPGLTRIPTAPDQDIDVLFYGSINDRRHQVIEGLKKEGLRVHTAFGVYGSERDALIARAKVVLNLHYYETSILEMVRLSYLWANRKAVVTECSLETDLEPGLAGAARFVPYDQLVAACRELVADEAARHALESRAYEVMSARSEVEILRKVLAGEAEVSPSRPPLCSLIIPVFNKVEFTQQCVEKLREGTPASLYEAIFIDNASTDATPAFLSNLTGRVKVITNSENRGFVDACNQGAAEAEGRYLVFLNNDTAPLPGWLEALVAVLEGDPTVGAAGAQLVYPDGRLQEAGGLIFRDGSGWNFGRFGDPLDPAFNTPAEVDYCSGAALMVRRDLFERLGGFDRRYAPAYYEDTDLCFGLRSLGYKVMYCPTSTVIHFEGITAGTDLTSGFKRYQAINRETFVAKWAEALAKQDPPPSETGRPPVTADRRRLEPQAALSSAPAPHMLIVDPFLPLHDRASGSLRLFRIIMILRALKWDVTYIARDGRGQESYQRQLESLGVKVYATDPEKLAQFGQACTAPMIDLARILAEHPCQVAWLSFYDIAEQYLPDIRRISPGTMVVVDTVDVHFLRETRQAELAGDAAALARAAQTRERELRIYAQADRVVTVTDADAAVLRKAGLAVPTTVIPNIHPPVGKTPGWETRKGLVFVGNFNHTPNVDAALWLCQEIMPRVQALIPGTHLTIVGPNPPAAVQALASADVAVLGWVPDTAPHLDAARVSVAPLRVGAGMKGKVGEALSRGIPVVTTLIGAEGMGLEDGRHVLVADDADAFARAIARLHDDRAAWEAMAQAGRAFVDARYSVEAVGRMFLDLLQATPAPLIAPAATRHARLYPKCWCGGALWASLHPGYDRCEACGTFVSNEPRTDADLETFYSFDGYWHDYMASLDFPTIEERQRVILGERCPIWYEAMTRHKPKPASLLEIGCSEGSFLHYCKTRGVGQLVGIEIDPSTCAFAKRNFGLDHVVPGMFPRVELPFPRYEVIAAFDVLEHFTDPVGTLLAIRDHLEDDGICVFQTPCYQENDQGWMQFKPLEHLYLFDRQNVATLLDWAGLEILELNKGIIPEDMIIVARKRRGADQPELEARRRERAPKRIAIGLVEHMGDIVACEPVIRYLREQNPEAHLTWVTGRTYEELVKYHPDLDQTLVVDCLGDWIRLKREGTYDEIVDLHVNKRRCTVTGQILDKDIGLLEVDVTHYYQHGSLLAAFCQGAGLPPLDLQPRMHLPAAVAEQVNRLGLPPRYVVIHADSAEETRNWRDERWRALVGQILQDMGMPVVEVGTRAVCAEFTGTGTGTYLNLCGQLSLLESAEVIRRARLFIGVDSGPAHMANALGTRGLVLLGKYRIFDHYTPFSGDYGRGTTATLLRAPAGEPASNLALDLVAAQVRQALWDEPAGGAGDRADGSPRARLIAFHLPQFHPIPENDRWWGRGFTEWTNVAKAQPLFPGHHQPQLPGELGFYDLRLPEAREAQARLAREYGIEGFCFWHYWFDGKLLLEHPLLETLSSGAPNFPFCLAWANENWTRRWDGQASEILQAQTYGGDRDDAAHFAWLLPFLKDRRALAVDGRPMFLIYRPGDLPNPARTIALWRRLAQEAGLPGLYLVAIITSFQNQSRPWREVGFDGELLFQPNFDVFAHQARLDQANRVVPTTRTAAVIAQYQNVWPLFAALSERTSHTADVFASVVPGWDNTARRAKGSFILADPTPEQFGAWLDLEIQRVQHRDRDRRLVFLNAWNEWAEGNHLEPDANLGRGLLEAVRHTIVRPEESSSQQNLIETAGPKPINHPPVSKIPPQDMKSRECPICNRSMTWVFRRLVMNKHEVDYWRCGVCGFVRTDEPHWLIESYSDHIIAIDTGIVQRPGLLAPQVEGIIRRTCRLDGRFLDFGGGTGLFVRLMRDRGFDFYRQDKFVLNSLALGFDLENLPSTEHHFDLVTAFEVFEHLPDPIKQVAEILRYGPSVIFTTELIPDSRNEPLDDWGYLGTAHGQHVSFYTSESLKRLGERLGAMYFSSANGLHILTKDAEFQTRLARAPSLLPLGSLTLSDQARLLQQLNQTGATDHPDSTRSVPGLRPQQWQGPLETITTGGTMHEASKALMRRLHDIRFATRYFIGHGIDVGAGSDSLAQYAEQFPLIQSCRDWDIQDGDAQYLASIPDESLDFVHSSHCLEHMVDPREALSHWLRVLKPGGHLIVTIPDEDLYEQGVFPSTWNPDHKWTFTLHKPQSWSNRSINLTTLVAEFADQAQTLKVELLDASFRFDLLRTDQTLTPVGECALEFILRKRSSEERIQKGRLPKQS